MDRFSTYLSIKPGSRVTIETKHGTDAGRAVMLGPAGWVLNCGGRHGRTAIASPANVLSVRTPRADNFTLAATIVNGGAVSA